MRRCRSLLSILCLAPAIVCASATTDPDPVPAAVSAAIDSVVSVRVRDVKRRAVWREDHFETAEVEGMGAGSGVVVSEDGLILTCAHVVDGARGVRIDLAGGRVETATVVAVDAASDLALLRASGGGYRPIRFASGDVPATGTPAFIVGNRDDRGPEIEPGRIGIHRLVRTGVRPIEFWAEVEGRIGPGNSGGAVLSAQGELIGIPGLQVVMTGTPESTAGTSGLFIPAAHARRALGRLRNGSRPSWAWLGLLLEDPLLAQTDGRAWLPGDGPVVRQAFVGAPAAAAGCRKGDRIVAIGSRSVRDAFEAQDAVLDLAAGQATTLTIERDGALVLLEIAAALRPDDPRPDPLDDFALHTGLRLQPDLGSRSDVAPIALASMSRAASRGLAGPEAALLAERPRLASVLPGADLLRGGMRRTRVTSEENLASLMTRCFVDDQFVALVHWEVGSGQALDRVHVHRKVYPIII
jgi:S1-C subfamily serine protease